LGANDKKQDNRAEGSQAFRSVYFKEKTMKVQAYTLRADSGEIIH